MIVMTMSSFMGFAKTDGLCRGSPENERWYARFRKAHKYKLDEKVIGVTWISPLSLLRIPLSVTHEAFPLTQLSIGVEIIRRNGSFPQSQEFNRSYRDVSPRQALDSFVADETAYSWRVSSEVINIFPRESDSKLDIRVPRFVVHSTDAYTATMMLVSEAQHLGVTLDVRGIPPNFWRHAPRITLDLSEPTLRDCLNAFASKDPGSRWQAIVDGPRISVRIIPTARAWEAIMTERCKGHDREVKERLIRDGFVEHEGGFWSKSVR
jgi:hypothetical protein